MEQSWLEATPSKTAFAFGLVLGLGVAALAGFVIVLTMFFTGSLPAKSAALENTQAANKPAAVADANVPTAPTGPVDIKVLPTDYQTGPKDAKVTIVEYSDFQCPYCKQFSATIDQMLKDYKDKVLFVYPAAARIDRSASPGGGDRRLLRLGTGQVFRFP